MRIDIPQLVNEATMSETLVGGLWCLGGVDCGFDSSAGAMGAVDVSATKSNATPKSVIRRASAHVATRIVPREASR